MTPELLHLALWIIGGCTVTIVGAVVWLASLVFRIGKKYGAVEIEIDRLEKGVEKLDRSTEALARLPLIEQKLDQLAASHGEERRRWASEWPEYRSKVDRLWEKVFSLQSWRRSQGQFGDGE